MAILCRLYNQREELAKLSSKLLILFDEDNIQVYKLSRKKLKTLAKNVDESEKWIPQLKNEVSKAWNVLQATTEYFEFFNKKVCPLGAEEMEVKNDENEPKKDEI